MSVVVSSNKATIGSTVWPTIMRDFVDRVNADGGQIGEINDLYTLTKAIQDQGLTAAQVPFVNGASLGYKVDGSAHVTKLYDLWSASSDLSPGSTGNAANSVIDTSTGHPLLDLTAAGNPLFAYYRSDNTVNFAGGAIGCIWSGTLDNPTATSSARLLRLEDGSAVQEMSFENTASGDGKSSYSFWGFMPQSGIKTYAQIVKNRYAARRFFGSIVTSEGTFQYADDKCVAGNRVVYAPTYYAGKALKMTVGFNSQAPLFMYRLGAIVNGTITMAQFRKLMQALGALG